MLLIILHKTIKSSNLGSKKPGTELRDIKVLKSQSYFDISLLQRHLFINCDVVKDLEDEIFKLRILTFLS